MKTEKKKCYYEDFGECTCSYAACRGKSCTGADTCKCFITENEYFNRMMSGTLQEVMPKEDAGKARRDLESRLRPEKSRKQIKREEKLEKAKNGDGSGFCLGDDPVFKDLFTKEDKKKK